MTAWFAICAALLLPQTPAVSGVVTDSTGAPVQGAVIQTTTGAGKSETSSANDGTWTIELSGAATQRVVIRVAAPGFAAVERELTLPASAVRIELHPVGITERITVSADTATRLAVESSATTLDAATLELSPALMLDDQLRSVPGFSLFRRTSSRVANPTTQGVTLRGMSASGASRTLVLVDGVPLNDPFGAWVYWDRVPMTALQRVDVIRGSSGDVHGNDALGGVIRLSTRTSPGVELRLEGGSLGTARASGYAARAMGRWTGGITAESATTDGYIVIAPEARGPIDTRASSKASSAGGWLGVSNGSTDGVMRGGYFSESRGNGTPGQINATVTRWGAARAHGLFGGGAWEARGDVTAGNYRQTFSAITGAGRTGERLTSLQWVRPGGEGLAGDWVRAAGRTTMLVSLSTRSVDADLQEAAFSLTGVLGPTVLTPAKQRSTGVVVQGRLALTPDITLEGGLRAERWTADRRDDATAHQALGFFEPRAAASFRLSPNQTLRVSWLTGFRTPTMNELYRGFRVGNTMTLANPALDPEESWGPEIAYTQRHARWTGRAIFYTTKLGGAIYNRTLSSTPALITRQRDNADARTTGSELELELRVWRGVNVTTSWAFNHATFTKGELDGKRVPQVPRAQGAVGLRATAGQFAGSLDVRIIGAQFDDDRNDFKLNQGSLVDARAGWRLSKGLELFGAIENLFDEELDTGRTPIRTIGQPRAGRAGLNLRF
jgi:outer membrane receptor protein involved in Fe transport